MITANIREKIMDNDRKGYIGGSDIAAVMGLSPWKTPLQLYLEKTGTVEPADLSDNEAVELGTELEDFVAKKFERKTGKAVRRAPCYYQDKEHGWMRCQVDRLVTGTDELLEVKTTSLWKEKDWDGEEIPSHYILQVQWQLMITGRTLGWIAVLIGGQKFLFKQIKEDKELQRMMRERAIIFWGMVEALTPPSAILGDDEALLALHPKSNEQLQMLQEFETAIAHRQELSGQIDELQDQKDALDIKLKEACGDFLGFKTEKYQVTWTPMVTTRVDTEALKKAGLYESYSKKSETRRLSIKLNKGGK